MSATSSIGKRILIAIPVAAALFGWQYYSKNQEGKEARAEMIQMCGDEADCVAAVEKYAETCFGDAYQFGRRSGVDMDKFVACVNKHAGQQFFVSVPAEE